MSISQQQMLRELFLDFLAILTHRGNIRHQGFDKQK